MADTSTSNGAPAGVQQGVLSNLPRTRPQRPTARRTAAREKARVASTDGPRRAAPARKLETRDRPRTAARTSSPPASRRRAEKAPPQGFECEEATSTSVQPPGGPELVVSAAELAGELAKAGISRGERLVRDLLGRLPLG